MIKEKIDEFMYNVFGEYTPEKDRIDNNRENIEMKVESIFPNAEAAEELLTVARRCQQR